MNTFKINLRQEFITFQVILLRNRILKGLMIFKFHFFLELHNVQE